MTRGSAGRPGISFVIPALNEESGLADTLRSIHRVVPATIPYEIIVADHDSVDRTADVAREHGARVETFRGGTIGSLRNRAAKIAQGDVLVFLDADVCVTPAWASRLPDVISYLKRDEHTITGSRCEISSDPSWLEVVWFRPRKRHSHLGTGHMILRRSLFEGLGGFDPSLETGEDYEFSIRAREHGASLVPDQALLVHHNGFPKTLREFLRREAWHGRSDFDSVRSVLRSRVAQAAIAFATGHAVALAAALLGSSLIAALAMVAIAAICLASAVYKFGLQGPVQTLAGTALYYLYFWGRILSILKLGGRTR